MKTGVVRQNVTNSISLQAEKETSQKDVVVQFTKLFSSLEENNRNPNPVSSQRVMEKVFGFRVRKAPSSISGSGFGKSHYPLIYRIILEWSCRERHT